VRWNAATAVKMSKWGPNGVRTVMNEQVRWPATGKKKGGEGNRRVQVVGENAGSARML